MLRETLRGEYLYPHRKLDSKVYGYSFNLMHEIVDNVSYQLVDDYPTKIYCTKQNVQKRDKSVICELYLPQKTSFKGMCSTGFQNAQNISVGG